MNRDYRFAIFYPVQVRKPLPPDFSIQVKEYYQFREGGFDDTGSLEPGAGCYD